MLVGPVVRGQYRFIFQVRTCSVQVLPACMSVPVLCASGQIVLTMRVGSCKHLLSCPSDVLEGCTRDACLATILGGLPRYILL